MANAASFVPFRFVPQPNPDQSQLDKELEVSEQRSHAARVSHQMRKEKQIRSWLNQPPTLIAACDLLGRPH